MIFTRLTITNLGVYRGRHEFELRPQQRDGETRPIVLFGGKNGAGKTTILDAIRLCLYGRSTLGMRVRRADYETYIRQRFHRDAQQLPVQSASVGMLFEHVHAGVLSTYDAVRSWRLDGTAVHEHISIYKDGQPFQEIAPEYWNDFLRDLIPPGLADLFFFDGEQIQALADEEREAETLAAAVRGLLNIDLIERLRSDISVYLRQQEKQDRSRLQQSADEAEAAHRDAEQRVNDRRQDLAQLQAKLDRVAMQIDKARQALLREGAGFIHQRDAIEQRQQQVARELDQTREAIRELATGLLPFSVAPQWARRLRERLMYEAGIEQANLVFDSQQMQAAQVALKLLQPEFQTSTAPQVLPQDWAQIAGAIQGLLQPTPPTDPAEIRHQLAAQDREKLLGWIASASQQVPEQLHQLSQRLEQLETEQHQLQQSLKQVPTDDVALPLLDEFNHHAEDKGRLEEQYRRVADEFNQLEYQLAGLARERAAAWQRLATIGDADARVDRAAKVQVILQQYLVQITEIKIQELEQAIAQFFNLLCRKRTLVREVKINMQSLTVSLYSLNRVPLPKSDLSAGEKQLYATALLWALRSVSGRALPIIIDTPMGRLDSDHRDAMLTTFFPHAAHQVLLLSTDTEIDPAAFRQLEHAVSHTFRLEFDQDTGSTHVERGYFAPQAQEALA
ncbi:MAG TPA: DNA sulfur modification protein DndD [Kouleothrix sp.]|mgnify:CR=1 FL=1|uniref:DNA sulfur modification protein DndD n=1 Tax=Kouleothrix sp. TaxID=2779161 RepID=UPI002C56D649|nr:DNA sulfur modification protein DndD [Kouleothrix sp.]